MADARAPRRHSVTTRRTWSSASTTNLKGLRKGDPDPHDNPVVAGALDELIGPGAWRTGHHWGQVLVTFPNVERWDVPHRPWHLDYGYDYPRDVIWGVNIFLCIDDVLPGGGGTVVLHRSPQLIGHFVDGLRPAERTQKQHRLAFQASHPYLTALADPSDTEDRVAGSSTRRPRSTACARGSSSSPARPATSPSATPGPSTTSRRTPSTVPA